MSLARPGGHIANIGVHGASATLHLETLWIKDVTITTGLVDTFSTPTFLKLLADINSTQARSRRTTSHSTSSSRRTTCSACGGHRRTQGRGTPDLTVGSMRPPTRWKHTVGRAREPPVVTHSQDCPTAGRRARVAVRSRAPPCRRRDFPSARRPGGPTGCSRARATARCADARRRRAPAGTRRPGVEPHRVQLRAREWRCDRCSLPPSITISTFWSASRCGRRLCSWKMIPTSSRRYRSRRRRYATSRPCTRIDSRGRAIERRDEVERRRLPAARRTLEHDELAVGDGERQVVEHEPAAAGVRLHDVLDLAARCLRSLMLQRHQWREPRRLHRRVQRAEHGHRARARAARAKIPE